MAKKLRKGDAVEWNSHGGKKSSKGVATGVVIEKLTAPMTIKGHEVKASKESPEYLVRSDHGAKAAHKPSALRKRKATARQGKTWTGGRPQVP